MFSIPAQPTPCSSTTGLNSLFNTAHWGIPQIAPEYNALSSPPAQPTPSFSPTGLQSLLNTADWHVQQIAPESNVQSSPAQPTPSSSPTVAETGLNSRFSTAPWRAQQIDPECNVYVFGFPPNWTETELQTAFCAFGNIVSAKVVRKPDGTSRGYGFVAYDSPRNARIAIARVDQIVVDGRKLTVKLKEAKSDAMSGGSKSEKPLPTAPGSAAYVHFMPQDWDELTLKRHFTHCGPVASTKVVTGEDGKSKGAGFVNFIGGPECVLKAIVSMNNFAAAPNKFLSVNPKKGEEDFLPPMPHLAFPSPGNIRAPPDGSLVAPGSTIFVYYVPSEWGDLELFIHFNHMGPISGVSIKYDGRGKSKGFGFVSFSNKLSAARAVKAMNGFDTGDGNRLHVTIKKGEESHTQDELQKLAVVPDYAGNDFGKAGKAGKATATSTSYKGGAQDANLYVYGFPAYWTENELQQTFSQYGNILSVAIARNEDGAPKGYGFVAFDNARSAAIAIATLDQLQYEGRLLCVRLKSAGKATGPSGVKAVAPDANLYVNHLPEKWTEIDLRSNFERFGNIVSTTIARNPDGTSRGYGFVGFDNAHSASRAIADLDGMKVEGLRLNVKLKSEGTQGAARMASLGEIRTKPY